MGVHEPVHLLASRQESQRACENCSISGLWDASGPFACADRWDEPEDIHVGLAISGPSEVQVMIDSDSVIIKPDVAESHHPKSIEEPAGPGASGPTNPGDPAPTPGGDPGVEPAPAPERKPTRFTGIVMISADRTAQDIHQIVEAIIEQPATLPGSDVSLKLEIDAEVPSGLDRGKVRALIENATTLGFIDKSIK